MNQRPHRSSSGCTRLATDGHITRPIYIYYGLFVSLSSGQTYKLPGFKDPAREMPTPPSEYIPLPAALRRRRPAYFLWRGGNLGMAGNSATALRG